VRRLTGSHHDREGHFLVALGPEAEGRVSENRLEDASMDQLDVGNLRRQASNPANDARAATTAASASRRSCGSSSSMRRAKRLSGTATSLCVLGLERFGDQGDIALAGGVVEVLHGRLDVGVAHPLLDSADVGFGELICGGADHAHDLLDREDTACC